MLKEIHHRVKNNLQLISSLLSLQSQNIHDPDTKKLFNISRDRVQSMSLVHSQLYETADLTDIDFEKYTNELGRQLILSYCGSRDDCIKINTKASNIRFGIDTAIPCGLILNELIVNSIKHAFNGKNSGIIDVDIKELSAEKYLLTVSDNGTGFQYISGNRDHSGMGMKLIEALTSQLSGSIHVSTQRGTKFEIEFEKAKYKKRVEVN
jgi:two-component sensor histidine kinase